MKKLLFPAVAALCIFIGCDETRNGEVLEPEGIKEKMEDIGVRLADELKMSNWKETSKRIKSLSNTLEEVTDDNYDISVIDEFIEDINNLFFTESEESLNNHYYSRFKAMIRLSAIKNHFTLEGTAWKMTDANDFQIKFNDPEYGQVIATLKVADESKPILIYKGSSEDYYETYYEEDYVCIPGILTMTVSVGGAEIANCLLRINYVDGDKDGVLDTDDSFKGSFEVNFDKYSETTDFNISSRNIELTLSAKHDSRELALTRLSVQGITTDIDLSADNIDNSEDDLEDFSFDCTKASFEASVLKELKATAFVTEMKDLIDLGMDMSECDDITTAGKYAERIEKLVNSAVFIDNTKQATIGLEVFEDNGEYWYAEPVIRFEDGSSYALFYDFFNEADFSRVINRFEDLVSDIESLFD